MHILWELNKIFCIQYDAKIHHWGKVTILAEDLCNFLQPFQNRISTSIRSRQLRAISFRIFRASCYVTQLRTTPQSVSHKRKGETSRHLSLCRPVSCSHCLPLDNRSHFVPRLSSQLSDHLPCRFIDFVTTCLIVSPVLCAVLSGLPVSAASWQTVTLDAMLAVATGSKKTYIHTNIKNWRFLKNWAP
jgi:hypothetical protein